MRANADGIAIGDGPDIPWSEVGAIIHQSMYVGYGARDHLRVRLRFTPNGTAARRAERIVRHLLNEPGFAISDTGLLPKQLLDRLRGPLRAGGWRLDDTPRRRFRGVYMDHVYPLSPLDD